MDFHRKISQGLEIVSNLQRKIFDLKVRHRGSRPNIFVRSFRSFTTPFCRVASHTLEEVRDILSTLEQEYQPLFPQLNPAINGPVRSMLGSPIQSSTRPAQAASRWTI